MGRLVSQKTHSITQTLKKHCQVQNLKIERYISLGLRNCIADTNSKRFLRYPNQEEYMNVLDNCNYYSIIS
jgi:hypothetical protein